MGSGVEEVCCVWVVGLRRCAVCGYIVGLRRMYEGRSDKDAISKRAQKRPIVTQVGELNLNLRHDSFECSYYTPWNKSANWAYTARDRPGSFL